MSYVADGILWLHSLGFFTVVLPFILIYTIVFGILRKTNIWGNPHANYDAMFAFCLAFFTIYRIDIAENLPLFIARVGFLFIIVVVLMIVAGVAGLHEVYMRPISFVVVGLYLVYLVIDTFVGTDVVNAFIAKIPISAILPVVLTIAVFAGILAFITGRSSEDAEEVPQKETKPVKKPETKKKPAIPRQQYPPELEAALDEFSTALKQQEPTLTDAQARNLALQSILAQQQAIQNNKNFGQPPQ